MSSPIPKRYAKGDRVVVASFLGAKETPEGTRGNEDYWKLIGQIGDVISEIGKSHPAFPERGDRVLVRFVHVNIREMGLECHNSSDNSLWLFSSDLHGA